MPPLCLHPEWGSEADPAASERDTHRQAAADSKPKPGSESVRASPDSPGSQRIAPNGGASHAPLSCWWVAGLRAHVSEIAFGGFFNRFHNSSHPYGRKSGLRFPESQTPVGPQVGCWVFEAQGSRLKVRGSRFEAQGSRFEVQGSRFKVRGSRFEVQGSGFKVRGFRFPLSAFPLPASCRAEARRRRVLPRRSQAKAGQLFPFTPRLAQLVRRAQPSPPRPGSVNSEHPTRGAAGRG